ncbi:MAG: DUF1616 domain-containing protein [Eubacteriales bacterium]
MLKMNLKNEYLLIMGMTLFTLIIVLFSGFFRVILGLPYVLIVPGYLLTVILFPKTDDLEDFARITLSVGLSIVIVPLIGLLHNYLSLVIDLLPLMFSLTLFNIVLMVMSWFKRKKIPDDERFELYADFDIAKWIKKIKENKVIYLAMLITGLSIIVTLIFMLSFPKNIVNFTEFYITRQDGTAAHYSEPIQPGDYVNVNVIIVCNENQTINYRLEIKADGELIQSVDLITLDHLEKWENTVSFKTEKPNEALKIEFLLYTDQNIEIYRQLKLWLRVTETDSETVYLITEEGEINESSIN